MTLALSETALLFVRMALWFGGLGCLAFTLNRLVPQQERDE